MPLYPESIYQAIIKVYRLCLPEHDVDVSFHRKTMGVLSEAFKLCCTMYNVYIVKAKQCDRGNNNNINAEAMFGHARLPGSINNIP